MKCPGCDHEVTEVKYVHRGTQRWDGKRWEDNLYSVEHLCGECDYCFADAEIGQFSFYIDALKAKSIQALRDGKLQECIRLYNKAWDLERKQS